MADLTGSYNGKICNIVVSWVDETDPSQGYIIEWADGMQMVCDEISAQEYLDRDTIG